jgi:hypothetical protein
MIRAGIRIGGIWIALFALMCLFCNSGNGPDEPKDLEITYPKGGETFTVGQKVTVTWNAAATVSTIYFKLSTDNGATWTQSVNANSIDASAGSYEWAVGSEYWPANPAYPSDQCMLKILEYNNESLNDVTPSFRVHQ